MAICALTLLASTAIVGKPETAKSRRDADDAATIASTKRAADLGAYVITACSELRGVGALPAHLRNELPGTESDDMRLVQLCRSAPGVGTTFVAARDGMDLEDAGRIARLPPMTDAARYLLEDDPLT